MKKIISLLLSIVVLFQVSAEAFAAYTEDRAKTYKSGSCTITYTIQNEWDNCRQIQMAITNNGSETVRNWALKFDGSGEITNIWNVEVCQNDGEIIALRNSGYNYEIIPDGTVEFGFQVRGDDLKLPKNMSLCNKTVDSTDNAEIGYEIQNSWDGGFIAEVSVTNNSDMPLEAWRLSFNGNFEITNLWNANKLYSDNGFLVENNVSTTPIAKGETKTFGFQGVIDSSETPEMSDFTLMSVVIDLDSEMPVEPNKPIEPTVPDKTNKITCYAQYVSEAYAYEIYWKSTATSPVVIYDNTDGAGWCKVDEVDYNSSYFYDLNNEFEEKYVKITQQIADHTIESKTIIIRNTPYGYLHTWQDSDDDGVSDYYEDIYGTDENSPDTDNDGLTDYEELYITKTNPLVFDSTGNGVGDADDDLDNDGLSNKDEVVLGTSPNSADTDNDGLFDYDEIYKYKTDPINADSDGDTLNDGDEIVLGLDPNNPETFGVPDSEYKIEQTISAESQVLESVNNENNPYKISLEITATGNVKRQLLVEQSSFSSVVECDAMLGGAIDIAYLNGDIERVKLSYQIDSEHISNDNNEHLETDFGTQGIRRYNIFRYFEGINMLLPVMTEFDEESNTLYAETDELGTYCVLDMEVLMRNFGVEPEEISAHTVSRKMYSAAPAEGAEKTKSDKYCVTFVVDDRGNSIPLQRIKNEIDRFKETAEINGSNIDVQIISQSKKILFDEYVVITDKLSDIIEKADKSDNNYIFELYGDENVIFEQNIAEELCHKAIEKDIRISVFTPFDDELKGYQRQLVDVTGGMTGNGFDEFTDKNIYEYVFDEKYVAKEYLSVILATGYKKIVLDTLLYPNGENPSGINSDTDRDGLSDWDEVMTNLLTYDEFGNYALPTVRECANKLDKVPFYVTEALLRDDILNQYWYTQILPIKSDPTSSDGDGDDILDVDDEYPLFQQEVFNSLNPVDELIKNASIRDEMVTAYKEIVELNNSRRLNKISHKNYLIAFDTFECLKDIIRANYILTSYCCVSTDDYMTNGERYTFNKACFGDDFDEQTRLFNNAIRYGSEYNRIALIVIQKLLAYNGFYEQDTFGTFDYKTYNTICDINSLFLTDNAESKVYSMQSASVSNQNLGDATPELLSMLVSAATNGVSKKIPDFIIEHIRKMKRIHDEVEKRAAEIIINSANSSDHLQLRPNYTSVEKITNVTVKKGGRKVGGTTVGGTTVGYADILAQYEGFYNPTYSKVWEVKSAYIPVGVGAYQIRRYINASASCREEELRFYKPLYVGDLLDCFYFYDEESHKYVVAFSGSVFNIVKNKNGSPENKYINHTENIIDLLSSYGNGLIRYITFDTESAAKAFVVGVLGISWKTLVDMNAKAEEIPTGAIIASVCGIVVIVVGAVVLTVCTAGTGAPVAAEAASASITGILSFATTATAVSVSTAILASA